MTFSSHKQFQFRVVRAALAHLRPRQRYAARVIRGEQLWSGADLRGAAKRWSGYAHQRSCARRAVARAGGEIVPIEHGALRLAVEVGQDDYGDALYVVQEEQRLYRSPAAGRRWLVRI